MSRRLARVPDSSERSAPPPGDPLMSFDAEDQLRPAPGPVAKPATIRHPANIALAAVTLAVLGAVAVTYALGAKRIGSSPSAAASAATGTVSFTSEPAGATVAIDGQAQGVTPLKLTLASGAHRAEIALGTATKALPFTVDAGGVLAQHVEFVGAALTETGRLDVTTDPPGARLSIDGAPVGRSPLTLPSLTAGKHTLTINSDGATVQRSVTISAGATATVMIALPANAASSGGWMQIKAPFELQIFENDQLIGSSGVSRLMLPGGTHDLDVVNTALEFRSRVRVTVVPGSTTSAPVTVPNGTISVNALPWADVTIDGHPVGTTPLRNLSVPIGSHEIVWKNPKFGERSRTVSVPARTPVRIGVDFSG
jgi:hypothetical protein